MYGSFASNYTQNDLSASRVIAAGSVHVYGVTLSNNTGGEAVVTIEDADAAAIMIILMPDNSNFQTAISFLADNGVTISSAGNAAIEFSIFHSNTAGAA